MGEEQLKKIKIILPQADWHQYAAETLWVNPIGNGKYVLENSPFFANGLSYKDTVYAEYDENEGFPVFKEVIERSKHSTYRIFLSEGKSYEEFEKYFDPLFEIGCTYEGMHNTHFSVDVPAKTDVMKAFEVLKKGEEDGIWFFESTHIGHDIKNAE
jgi:Domain of unknown function (DUF4265)